MKNALKLITLLMAVAVAGYGCGQSSVASAPGTGPAASAPTAEPAKTAEVTFKANFPKKGTASKSLIDPSTAYIDVYYSQYDGGNSGWIYLTPENPTATVKLRPAEYSFYATAYDSAYNELEYAGSSGSLAVGANTVLITFLNGKWSFVNSSNVATPIVFSNSSSIDGFTLDQYWGGSAKAAFDQTKPVYGNDYHISWLKGSDIVGESYMGHTTQFTGGSTNNSAVHGGWYNLTKRCAEDMCEEEVGDRMLFIMGEEVDYDEGAWSLLPPDEGSQDVSQYETSTVQDGNTIKGNLIEYTLVSASTEIITGVVAAKASSLPASKSKAEALKKAISGAKKSQSANTFMNDLTFAWYDLAVLCTDVNSDGTVDTGDWELYNPVDIDGDGTTDYYGWGSVSSWNDPNGNGFWYETGECSSGLEATDINGDGMIDTGGWYDDNYNGVADGWEFYDIDGDGMSDFGEFRFTHYLKESGTIDAYAYPFTAEGSALPGTQVQLQKGK